MDRALNFSAFSVTAESIRAVKRWQKVYGSQTVLSREFSRSSCSRRDRSYHQSLARNLPVTMVMVFHLNRLAFAILVSTRPPVKIEIGLLLCRLRCADD
jgi:hypothetical protein